MGEKESSETSISSLFYDWQSFFLSRNPFNQCFGQRQVNLAKAITPSLNKRVRLSVIENGLKKKGNGCYVLREREEELDWARLRYRLSAI